MATLADIAQLNGRKLSKRYNPITLNALNKGTASYLVRRITAGIDQGVRRFQIRVVPDVPCYPNCIVPLAGIIDYYTRLGMGFLPSRSLESHEYLSRAGLLHPFADPGRSGLNGYLDKIWRFTPDTHYQIVTGVMDDIRSSAEVERGILQSIELCLNEITDNVLNHSTGEPSRSEPYGFLMAQFHGRSERIAVSVYDTGVGIFESLRGAVPGIGDPREAIAAAMEKGVTSGNGRGNGLWILDRIVLANGGSLEISSGGARFSRVVSDGGTAGAGTYSKASSEMGGTTLVDFQLDVRKPVSIGAVLGHSPVDLWLESHEDGANEGDAVVRVAEQSRGFGTRIAARQVRTLAVNLSKEFEGRVILDFDGVDLITTSYADELVSKLAGREGLRDRLVVRNLNGTCRLAVAEVLKDAPPAGVGPCE